MIASVPISLIHVAGLVLITVVVTTWVGGAFRRSRASSRVRRRAGRGARAEAMAERLLERHGYTILDRQVRGSWPLIVGGEAVEAGVRADLLVRRRGRVYIAEVKSGALGARADAPDTRRQLLEYRLAFDCDGVLLVNMIERVIVELEFPLLEF
jgi:Holliday junction resolvase-like predicted endonuclease